MKNEKSNFISKNKNFLTVLFIGIILSLILTFLISNYLPSCNIMGTMKMFRIIESTLKIKVFISTLNVILIFSLFWNYMSIYKEMPNKFTLSLLIFTVALFLYAISANPVLHLLFGFRGGGLGPFRFIPDTFALIAVVLLLQQSFE
ncbi:MAG: hypothetical protein ABEK17_03170 [Candidatus Aenigmatarchaeota archaeon]